MSRESRMSTLSASLEDVIADEQLPGDKPNGQQLGRAGMEPFSPEFRCDESAAGKSLVICDKC